MNPGVLRWAAVAIALVGVMDPAVTSTRRTKPEVTVVASDPRADRALAEQVAKNLEDDFTVISAPFSAAGGTVVVGRTLPPNADDLPLPAFAVMPSSDPQSVRILSVRAPRHAALESRVPVEVTVQAGRTARVELALWSDGIVVDRVVRDGPEAGRQIDATLHFAPTQLGAAPLRVTAGVPGATTSASVDVATDIRVQRWAILFFDPRPSWMSTFVRRTIERDARFVTTSRVVTSRNVSTDAGRPPSTLDDLSIVSQFDAIVVGAPEALSVRDVAGLDTYLRRRGGSVILLLDQRVAGAYERLTGTPDWVGANNPSGVFVTRASEEIGASDSTRLRVSEIAWPRTLPPAARPFALSRSASPDTSPDRPVIWQMPVGAGRLVVSGALDAWRYRDPVASAFDVFWRMAIADAAGASAPAIDIELAHPVVATGERTSMAVTVRDAALAELSEARAIRASVSAVIDSSGGGRAVRLWPDGAVGRFTGSFRAPDSAGMYRIVVTADGLRADAALVVAPAMSRATPDDADLLAAWTSSRNGSVISSASLENLTPALRRALPPTARRETWYPMRSGWWILPFSLLLCAEWLWRRRRGLA